MTSCNECLYQIICNVYADAGLTGVPKSDVRACRLYSDKKEYVVVVRCRECKHYVAGYCTRDIKGRTNTFLMQPYDFCSYGKRRNEK